MAKNEKILAEIVDNFEHAYDSVSDSYDAMIEDLEFVLGETQWPADIEADRKSDGRPCLVINKLANFADQVSGELRQNTPSIKVKAVDSEADPETAEVLTGLIKNIEQISDADVAYDTAAESAVQCGKGSFRIVTEYADDDVFEQCIKIKRIKNPFTVVWDPDAQEWDKSDAKYCFVTEKISRRKFRKDYPDAAMAEFKSGKDRNLYWGQHETVRVAEYFKKKPVKKTLYQWQDNVSGETFVTDYPVENLEPIQTREVTTNKVVWYKTNGVEILEGPVDLPGKYIPIVDVWGKEVNIEDRTVYRGVVRNGKDPQRLYNYGRSNHAETVALAPKTPYLVTPKMIGPYQEEWNQAHKKNYPYLPFDIDPDNPNFKPFREPPPMISPGLLTEIQIADQELHDTTGLNLANLGKESNEKSGKAILARQREGNIANYHFYDNLARAMRYAARVLIDLIPKVYDTARVVEITGEDGAEKMVSINQPYQENGKEKFHDLTVGKYDVTVTIGPSYATQRDETAAIMLDLVSAMPRVGELGADILFRNIDMLGAQEMANRFKKVIPPEIRGAEPGEEEQQQQQPPDPEMIVKMQELQIKQQEQQRKEFETRVKAIKDLAEAESKERGAQLDQFRAIMEQIRAELQIQNTPQGPGGGQ